MVRYFVSQDMAPEAERFFLEKMAEALKTDDFYHPISLDCDLPIYDSQSKENKVFLFSSHPIIISAKKIGDKKFFIVLNENGEPIIAYENSSEGSEHPFTRVPITTMDISDSHVILSEQERKLLLAFSLSLMPGHLTQDEFVLIDGAYHLVALKQFAHSRQNKKNECRVEIAQPDFFKENSRSQLFSQNAVIKIKKEDTEQEQRMLEVVERKRLLKIMGKPMSAEKFNTMKAVSPHLKIKSYLGESIHFFSMDIVGEKTMRDELKAIKSLSGNEKLIKTCQLFLYFLRELAVFHETRVHRDLKFENVVINGKGAVFIDTEFSDYISNEYKEGIICGTRRYMPLHLLDRGLNHISRREDIFSSGRMGAIMFGATPIDRAAETSLRQNSNISTDSSEWINLLNEKEIEYSQSFTRDCAPKIREALKGFDAFSTRLIALFNSMQADDAFLRPTAKEALSRFEEIVKQHLPQDIATEIFTYKNCVTPFQDAYQARGGCQ